ncbi:hypothetical protein N8787_02935 [Opitutaceae bacterium]|nr:hypothetical protein [Opitutaceae bacterium]
MKTLMNVLGALSFLVVTSCSPSIREEIIERFPGGEKKVVAVYSGSGIDENILERRTYDSRGDLMLIEDLVTGSSKDWHEIHAVDTAYGMKAALQGIWYSPYGTAEFSDMNCVFKIEEDVFSYTLRPDMTISLPEPDVDGEHVAPKISGGYEFEFLDNETLLGKQTVMIDERLRFSAAEAFLHRSQKIAAEKKIVWEDKISKLVRLAVRDKDLRIIEDEILTEKYPNWYRDYLMEVVVRNEWTDHWKIDSDNYDESKEEAKEIVRKRINKLSAEELRVAALATLKG